MAKNQTFSEALAHFYPGAIVDANGEIAVIIDVLQSNFTGNVNLCVRFPRNVGNARPYDILELSPARTLGVEKWRPATLEQLQTRMASRRQWLNGEIEALLKTAVPANNPPDNPANPELELYRT
jgi:hypothetical protein